MMPRVVGKSRPLYRLGAYVILISANESATLIRRGGTGYCDGMLSILSGNVEHGETVEAAAIREVAEECGIEIHPRNLKLVHVMHRAKNESDLRLDFFFVCRNWAGKIMNLEPEKHSGFENVFLYNLPEDIIPYHLHALKMYQQENDRISYSKFSEKMP